MDENLSYVNPDVYSLTVCTPEQFGTDKEIRVVYDSAPVITLHHKIGRPGLSHRVKPYRLVNTKTKTIQIL